MGPCRSCQVILVEKIAHNKNQQGFTLLEIIVVIILISILALFSVDRLLSLRIAAEKASVTQVIGNIRSALGLEVARLALDNNMIAVAALAKTNPVPLLAQAPSNYLGEQEKNINEVGQWYFNKEEGVLVYNVIHSENFKTALKGLPRTRHQIKLIYDDKNNNQRFDLGQDGIAGLDLLPLEKFSWKTEANNN